MRDIVEGIEGSFPGFLTAAGGRLYFAADDGESGRELWASDGTPGTRRLRDINPGAADGFSVFTDFERLGDAVFFAADDGTHGVELWRSDGTVDGTALWKDIAVGDASGTPHQLTAVGDVLYFAADEGAFGDELWRTEASGRTLPNRDINPQGPSDPRLLTPFGAQLAFTADDGTHGVELWMSDGTARGTRLVRDINPTGSAFLPPRIFFMVSAGATLFFTADDGEHGTELWRSDGTPAGTSRVADIDPGAAGSFPAFLTAAGDRLLFQACEAAGGCEPWQVRDGVASRLVDLAPGVASSNPAGFTSVGGRVLFTADDGATGVELWADGACAGDCDGDGAVRIDELVRGVRIALGESGADACAVADRNADGAVSIDELVAAVTAALAGC